MVVKGRSAPSFATGAKQTPVNPLHNPCPHLRPDLSPESRYAEVTMNDIQIPIVAVHLETRFQGGDRVEYALLEPEGEVSPLRVLFSDLRAKLGDRFSEELTAEQIVTRIEEQEDLQLVVKINLEHSSKWEVAVRFITPGAVDRTPTATLSEQRRSRRLPPQRHTDIKLELGPATLEGTLYNISEHGLGIALLTHDADGADRFRVNEIVELVGRDRIRGRIASQYPAPGGCVLGIELKERFDYARLYDIEA